MTDNTEQQAVGGEDVQQKVHQTIVEAVLDGRQHHSDGVDYPADFKTLEIMQLISRHYIAKEAVTAAVGDNEPPSFSTGLEGIAKGAGTVRNEFRDKVRCQLNLDATQAPTPPDHSQCVSREAVVATLAKELEGISQTETDSDKGWWETSAGAEFGAKTVGRITDALGLNLDSGTDNNNQGE